MAENLPLELAELICSFLTLSDLKNTLTVSKAFQYASERASGAYTEFDLTENNAHEFISLYNGRRWSYLRHVRFRIHLPPYREDDNDEQPSSVDDNDNDNDNDEQPSSKGRDPVPTQRCRESSQELQDNDERYTKQIFFVFTTLHSLEKMVSFGRLQLTIFNPIREIEGCWHRKSTSWRLHLLSPNLLPELTSVRALYVHDSPAIILWEDKCSPKIDLRIVVDLAVKLPNLEYLGCKLDAGRGWTTEKEAESSRQYTRDWPGPHRDSRHDFAKALQAASLPPTLRQAQLDFVYPIEEHTRIDQTSKLPDLIAPAVCDPFSTSLRVLSTQLQRLDLKVVADETLFWPSNGSTSWPNLETLRVMFHMSGPASQWYFRGPAPPGEIDILEREPHEPFDEYPPLQDTAEDKYWDDYIEDFGFDNTTNTTRKFRVAPNEDTLVPFLTAFAKAALHMPALKEACLWSPLSWNPYDLELYEEWDSTQIGKYPDAELAWGITYLAPNMPKLHYSIGQSRIKSRQLWWGVGQWRPYNDLRRLFQEIGDTDTELIEYWEHEDYGQGLVLRSLFEQIEQWGWYTSNQRWPFHVTW